jgi:MoaD family protein
MKEEMKVGRFTVLVKYLSALRDKTGKKEEKLELSEGSSLHDIASRLREKYGISLPDPKILLVLNGKGYNQYPGKLKTELKGGDTILLLPPVSGG